MKRIYEYYANSTITKQILDSIKVGDLIKCNTWTKPLKVKAVSKNYFVMVRNHFGQPLYSVCEKIRCNHSRNSYSKGNFRIGSDSWVFGKYDYLLQENCEEAVKDFESGESELSVRRAVDLRILQIKRRSKQ